MLWKCTFAASFRSCSNVGLTHGNSCSMVASLRDSGSAVQYIIYIYIYTLKYTYIYIYIYIYLYIYIKVNGETFSFSMGTACSIPYWHRHEASSREKKATGFQKGGALRPSRNWRNLLSKSLARRSAVFRAWRHIRRALQAPQNTITYEKILMICWNWGYPVFRQTHVAGLWGKFWRPCQCPVGPEKSGRYS